MLTTVYVFKYFYVIQTVNYSKLILFNWKLREILNLSSLSLPGALINTFLYNSINIYKSYNII